MDLNGRISVLTSSSIGNLRTRRILAMKTLRLMPVGLMILLVCASAACSMEAAVPEDVVAAPPEPAPEDVIEGFFNWYTGYPGNPTADRILATNPVVTAGLVEKVETILSSSDLRGGGDPILCAQERPRAFTVEVIDRSADSVTAVVHSEFEGHTIYVGMMKVDGEWKIADVSCPTDPSAGLPDEDEVSEPEAPTPTADSTDQGPDAEEDEASESVLPAGWSILRDETYGFQLAYPPDWGHMDLPLYDPGAGGPPTVIKRFVILYPREWEEQLKPGGEPDPNVSSYPALSIEICVGTLEEFRREFMELGVSETVEVNGLTALHERDTYEDYNLIRTVFEHPTNDALRITLTDPVSGFSVRAEENEDILSLIPVVVSTFRFTE
jgi:hypothetical protein